LLPFSDLVHTVELHGEPFLLTYIHDISDSKKTEEALRLQAYTDGLTGLWNRAFFQRRFFEEMERVRRYGSHLSLVMFDIDHFKAFNDTHGHLCGDKALVRIADLVQKTIRVSDCFARWGGDEFLVFSPVPEEGALVFAERLRQQVKEARWPRGMRLTLSLGVIEATGDLSSEILMDRVDRAMYRAKRAGGDRVCVWGAESSDGVTHS
jgi:diguanylate cyclase (GGDEF)-like protein